MNGMSFPTLIFLSVFIFFTSFYGPANGAGGDCMSSGIIQCFECNSMEHPRCHDPFNYSIHDSEMPPFRPGGCKGCCVKMVQFIGTPHYQIKRTCTDDFEVNFFMVNHACMTEGHRHGHMCFCEEDGCNSAMPSSNKLIPAQAIGSFLVKIFSSFMPFDIYHYAMAMGVPLWSLCLLIFYQIMHSNLLSCSSLFPDIDTQFIKSKSCRGSTPTGMMRRQSLKHSVSQQRSRSSGFNISNPLKMDSNNTLVRQCS